MSELFEECESLLRDDPEALLEQLCGQGLPDGILAIFVEQWAYTYGLTEEWEQVALELMMHDSPIVRQSAVVALGYFWDELAVDVQMLVSGMSDPYVEPDSGVRRVVASIVEQRDEDICF